MACHLLSQIDRNGQPGNVRSAMGRQLSPVSEALKAAYGLFLAAFREAGSGGEAQGRGSPGKIPHRLLSAGPPVRVCVSDHIAAAGDRRRRASHFKNSKLDDLQDRRGVPKYQGIAQQALVEARIQADFTQPSRPKSWPKDARRQSAQEQRADQRALFLHSGGTCLELVWELARNLPGRSRRRSQRPPPAALRQADCG